MLFDLITGIGFLMVKGIFFLFPTKSFLPDVFEEAWNWSIGLAAKMLYVMPETFQTTFLALIQVGTTVGTVIMIFLLIRNIYQFVKIW